jgi:hypothetical protein
MLMNKVVLGRVGMLQCLVILVLLGGLEARLNAAEFIRWEKKSNRVSASFRDWPLEKVLTNIAVGSKWNVKIPEESGVMISGTYKDLPPTLALKHMFGHLNYAVFSSPKGGKPRLQMFLPSAESEAKAEEKKKAEAPTAVKKNPLNGAKKPNYADVMKRFDKNGDGLISNAEREQARSALSSSGK